MKSRIKEPFNLIAGIFGFVLMSVALFFLRIEVIALPFSTIGGSILATVIVNSIFIRKWRGLPIPVIAEALASKTKFIRKEQECELIFEIDNTLIKLKKRHRYSLYNPFPYKMPHTLSMFTDSSKAIRLEKSGFKVVIEPDGKELTGENLKLFIKYENGKHNFLKGGYKLNPGYKNNQFEFHSVVYYRLIDRLIWTVQELSHGFKVRIINKTGITDPFEIKINHHRESDIPVKLPLDTGDGYEQRIEIDSEILPYQGFELTWEIPESVDKL